MVGLTELCGHPLNVLACIPASNGLRDGSDLGLILDIVRQVFSGLKIMCLDLLHCE